MKKIHLIRCATLLLSSQLLHTALQAQSPEGQKRADTLRRELTVMTEDAIELEPLRPLDLSYTLPAPVVPSLQRRYLDTPLPYDVRPAVHPLSALSPLQGAYKRPEQKGYIFASAGLALAAKAGAGYRLLNNKSDLLDVFGRFLWEDAKVVSSANEKPKRQSQDWSLGARYLHRFDPATLEFAASFSGHKHNYYGVDEIYAGGLAGGNLVPLDPKLSGTHFLLQARLHHLDDATAQWLYDARFNLGIASASRVAGLWLEGDSRELRPEAMLDVSYHLDGIHRLGFNGGLLFSSLSAPQGTEAYRGKEYAASRLLLTLAPFYQLEDGSGDLAWQLKAGLRLNTALGKGSDKLSLFPKLDASLRYGSSFAARLELDASQTAYGVADLYKRIPYLHGNYLPTTVARHAWGRLSLQAKKEGLFSGEVFVRYASEQAALQLFPMLSQSATLQSAQLSFSPYLADYKQLTLGAELALQAQGVFTLSLKAQHHSYSKQTAVLSALPTLELAALAEYTPLEKLSLRAGYDFASAGKSYHHSSNEVLTLAQQHLLHGDVVYRLTPQLSLTAEARVPLVASPHLYYGYAQQPMQLLGGLQFRF